MLKIRLTREMNEVRVTLVLEKGVREGYHWQGMGGEPSGCYKYPAESTLLLMSSELPIPCMCYNI